MRWDSGGGQWEWHKRLRFMPFPLVVPRPFFQNARMTLSTKMGVFFLAPAVIAGLWVMQGSLAAIAGGVGLSGLLLNLALKDAIGDIQRFEREQRPDLFA